MKATYRGIFFLQSIRAALQVFTDHATVCDYQERQRLLTELVSLCTNSGAVEIAREIRASSAALQFDTEFRPQPSIQRGTITYGESRHISSDQNCGYILLTNN